MTRRGVIATDRLTWVFVVALGAIMAARGFGLPSTPWHAAAMTLTLLLPWLLARAPGDTPFMRLVGPAYPVIMAAGFYTAIGTMNLEAARNHDLVVQGWDTALFGGQVSVTWHQAVPDPGLSWLLHLCYGSYYLFVATVMVWHWRKTSRAAFERAAFVVALAFFASYLAFALWPVTGPRYFFGAATGVAAEVWPARLVHKLLEGGSAYGTAFPSSHIAVTWCAVLASWRAARRLSLALMFPAVCLALGTVYGQFHYAVDAVAGAAVALLLFALADPLRRIATPATRASS